jgi:uncharacterized protein YdhG (YjbR/CyaY superfamily)
LKKESTKEIWSKETPPAKDVDAFIKGAPKEAQAKLKQLRKIIQTIIPDAEEIISYKMPVYKYRGEQVVGFAGFKEHIGFCPMSGSFLDAFKEDLRDFKSSKGAVQFPIDKPLPVELIRKIILARIEKES